MGARGTWKVLGAAALLVLLTALTVTSWALRPASRRGWAPIMPA